MTPRLPGDRRRSVRHARDELPRALRLRVRAGHDGAILNLSALGILLDSTTRLLPGHRCTLHLSGLGGRIHVGGRVLRAEVVGIDPSTGVIYRGAVEFDTRCDIVREVDTRDGH